jgi:microcystin-dependent protein
LTTAQLPSHSHGINFLSDFENSQHTHGINLQNTPSGGLTTVNPAAGSGIIASLNNQTIDTTGVPNSQHKHNIVGDTAAVGSGNAHNIMQPFIVVSYIIKL